MQRYLLRRLLLVPVVLLMLSILVFAGIRAIPGDVVDIRLETSYTPERAEQLRDVLGLNKPIWQAYPEWLLDAVQGDLGKSLVSDRSVSQELRRRAPVTIELVVLSLIIQVILGVPLGVLAAVYRGSILDHGSRLVSIIFLAVPNFWIATLVLTFPSIWWGWAPPFGYTPFQDDPLRNLEQFIIPAAIIGLYLTAIILRLTRAELLEVLQQDYIRTARAKGLSNSATVLRHAMRNAMVSVVTVIGLALAGAIAGAVIIEQIFALPGLGTYGIEAINRRDYTAVQGFTLIVGIGYVLINLLVDVTNSYLNPRIRYT